MKQTEIDFERKELTDAGIKQAVDHADAVSDGWSERAYDKFLEYIIANAFTSHEFQFEEVRAFAERKGLEKPPSARAWGAIARRAVKAGLIQRVGFKSTNNPTAHGTICAVWKRI